MHGSISEQSISFKSFARISELIKEMADVRKKIYMLDGVDFSLECGPDCFEHNLIFVC